MRTPRGSAQRSGSDKKKKSSATKVKSSATKVKSKTTEASGDSDDYIVPINVISKRGHDWVYVDPSKQLRKFKPNQLIATCPSCNSGPIKWSDVRNKRQATSIEALRCNRQAVGKCDHEDAKKRTKIRKRKTGDENEPDDSQSDDSDAMKSEAPAADETTVKPEQPPAKRLTTPEDRNPPSSVAAPADFLTLLRGDNRSDQTLAYSTATSSYSADKPVEPTPFDPLIGTKTQSPQSSQSSRARQLSIPRIPATLSSSLRQRARSTGRRHHFNSAASQATCGNCSNLVFMQDNFCANCGYRLVGDPSDLTTPAPIQSNRSTVPAVAIPDGPWSGAPASPSNASTRNRERSSSSESNGSNGPVARKDPFLYGLDSPHAAGDDTDEDNDVLFTRRSRTDSTDVWEDLAMFDSRD